MGREEERSAAKSFFLGVLTGGAVGAIIALLYAPKPGKELRADIKNKAGELIDEAEEYIEKAKEKAGDIIHEGKKRSEHLISDAKKQAASLLADAEKILAEAKEKVSEEVKSKLNKRS